MASVAFDASGEGTAYTSGPGLTVGNNTNRFLYYWVWGWGGRPTAVKWHRTSDSAEQDMTEYWNDGSGMALWILYAPNVGAGTFVVTGTWSIAVAGCYYHTLQASAISGVQTSTGSGNPPGAIDKTITTDSGDMAIACSHSYNDNSAAKPWSVADSGDTVDNELQDGHGNWIPGWWAGVSHEAAAGASTTVGWTPQGIGAGYGTLVYAFCLEQEVTSQVKEVSGVAQASVKKISGVTIAAAKKISGVSNT